MKALDFDDDHDDDDDDDGDDSDGERKQSKTTKFVSNGRSHLDDQNAYILY